MIISAERMLELSSSDHLILRSVDEYDYAVKSNSHLFPGGPSPFQRGKILAHFNHDYSPEASVVAGEHSEVSMTVEVFFCSGHKRERAYVDRMVSIDGVCYSREELLSPQSIMPQNEIASGAESVRMMRGS